MKLLIAGAGGHGRVVADAAECTGRWTEICFLDSQCGEAGYSGDWPIIGALTDLQRLRSPDTVLIAAFGDVQLRCKVLADAQAAGYQIPVIVHPNAVVSKRSSIGPGTVILAGAVINAGALLGSGCIVNTGATVDHDCRLGDGVHICPGAHLAGEVIVGDRTWFGIGAVARQKVRIGADVVVGAGAVCVSDIRDGVTVMGVPARERKQGSGQLS